MMFKLVVFDLDFTLWDAGGTWCDHTNPPYQFIHTTVFDAHGLLIKLYDDVPEILDELRTKNIPIAVASRTGAPKIAQELINLFEIDHYFNFKQIFPASKIIHFKALQKESGIAYGDMLFFDDEYRNIEEISSLGVKSVLVTNGINKNMVSHHLPLHF